jgi:hypothetical protein
MARHPLSCRIEAGTTICMRISNSFSEGEIQVLEFIVQTLLRGGTPTMATRSADFPSLCRKVQAMKKKVHEQKARPQGGHGVHGGHAVQSGHDAHQHAHPDESSVGTVAAPSAAVLAEPRVAPSVEQDVDIARAV